MITTLLILAGLSSADPEDATSTSAQESTTPEIVVTGERIGRTLRETASSVVVLDQATLDDSSSDRLEAVLNMVPNVQLGSGEEAPAIRGMDSTGVLRNLFAFLGGTRPRTTLQIDGRPANYYEYVSSVTPLWDVERIEVYRSPQTTTQGRNAIAGAIFVETQEPRYFWEGRARAIVGEANTGQASLAVTGPLVADQLAFRFAGDVRRSTVSSSMADGIEGADISRDDYLTARLKLLATPSALPGLKVDASYAHTRSQSPQFEAIRRPFEKRRTDIFERTVGVNAIRSDAMTMRIAYAPQETRKATLTLTHGRALIRRLAQPGLGQTEVHARDTSAEAVVSWPITPALAILVGGHLLTNTLDQAIDISTFGVGTGTFKDDQDSRGLFTELEWHPSPRLTARAGVRYQHDTQDRFGQIGPAPIGISLDYGGSFEAVMPKLSLAFQANEAVTIGVLAQRAYNPGGTTISLRTRREDSFAAEYLNNYEAFARASFLGGRLFISGNVFHNDIRNAQRQLLVTTILPDSTPTQVLEFANAPRARTSGLEGEVQWQPSNAFSARAGVGVLASRLQEAVLGDDDSLGKEFQRSPRLSGVISVDWRPSAALKLSLSARHHSGYFSDDANSPALRVNNATVVDLGASYRLGRIKLTGYARNILDQFYMTYLFNEDLGTAGDPREVGVGVELQI